MEASIIFIGVGGEEKWSDFGSFLNVEQTGLQIGWMVCGVWRKKRVQDDSKVLVGWMDKQVPC